MYIYRASLNSSRDRSSKRWKSASESRNRHVERDVESAESSIRTWKRQPTGNKKIEEPSSIFLLPVYTSHLKWPAWLLPLKVLLGERKNSTDKPAVRRFYGPPINCSELSELGYTLNGFYLVKSKSENNSIISNKDGSGQMQVEVVYCTFKHPRRNL